MLSYPYLPGYAATWKACGQSCIEIFFLHKIVSFGHSRRNIFVFPINLRTSAPRPANIMMYSFLILITIIIRRTFGKY